MISIMFVICTNISYGQFMALEAGLSKHFIAGTTFYEQPNLNILLRHRIHSKFEYSATYYNIQTYEPAPDHEILPWNGDVAELLDRSINGIDLSWNAIPLVADIEWVGLCIGISARQRKEMEAVQCQYTADGWFECFLESNTYYEAGLNLQTYFNYYFWKNLGLSASVNERLFQSGPSSFSINLGMVYKLEFE